MSDTIKETKRLGSDGATPAAATLPAVRTGRLGRQLEWGAVLLLILWIIWLAALAIPLADLFGTSVSVDRRALVLAGVALFVGVYGWTAWHNALRNVVSGRLQSQARLAIIWWPVAILTILSLMLTLAAGPDWLVLFIFTSASAAGYLPVRPAAVAIASLVVLALAAGLLVGAEVGLLWESTIRVATVGISVASLTQAILLGQALQAARAEVARLAVAQERLRFARDLHDLLGHSLSLITLKSELAARLVETSPQRAGAEIRDVVGVARTALREVREAVAGYRQPTLASELQGAAEMLSAAGIAFEGPEDFGGPTGAEATSDADSLPAPVESALAWTVREGVTNVIRHSHARHCSIRLRYTTGSAVLAVIDDGTPAARLPMISVLPPTPDRQGGQGSKGDKQGNGIAGLRERVEALGGSCQAGRLRDGGFRLSVTLPLGQNIEADHTDGTDSAIHRAELPGVERTLP